MSSVRDSTGEGELPSGKTALLLTGGGARAAYQVGFLRCLARRVPELGFPIVMGFSSGAINAAHLASRPGPLPAAIDELHELWAGLSPSSVMRVDALSLAKNVLLWALQLLSGGRRIGPEARSLVDCSPLVHLLRRHLAGLDDEIAGIRENLDEGTLEAVAVSTTCYTTSDSVTFAQGRGFSESWSRPGRVGFETSLTVDHVLASSALPFVFPAVRIGSHWHGDGAIRLPTPLSPAIELGADRIVVVSTNQADDGGPVESSTDRYPPPAMIAGSLLSAVMEDRLTDDVRRLRRLNQVMEECGDPAPSATNKGSRAVPGSGAGPDEEAPREEDASGPGAGGGSPNGSGVGSRDLRRVGAFVLRPSIDLGKLARRYEERLPRSLGFMVRGLGTREMESPSLLSMLLFDPEYIAKLIEIGERDAEARRDELRRFLTSPDPAGL